MCSCTAQLRKSVVVCVALPLEQRAEGRAAARGARPQSMELPTGTYVDEFLTPTLSEGLAALCRARPAEPMVFLANYLLEHKPPLPARPPSALGPELPPLEVLLSAAIQTWGRSVFEQFDTDKNGVLDGKELSRALKSLPKTKPTMLPPGAKFMSVDEMIAAMDADGNGTVDLTEWLDNLGSCAGLAAALAESVNEHGMVAKFRSFEEQKAKREKEIAALEGKLMTASPVEMEAIAKEMQDYERQVESLAKKIAEANANAAARSY